VIGGIRVDDLFRQMEQHARLFHRPDVVVEGQHRGKTAGLFVALTPPHRQRTIL